MKKYLFAMTLLLTLAATTQAAAQKHRHGQAVTAAATTATTDTTGVEAFSDTTSVADEDSTYNYSSYGGSGNYSVNVTTPVDHILNSVQWNDVAGMFMIICVVAIIFLLSPVLIIIAIFYFINKSRKDKLKLAQMAIQNGQPIPEQLIRKSPVVYDYNYRGGLKQMFLGIGLMIFLGMILGKFGFGIGALVFFIGLGKFIIALLDKHQAERGDYSSPTRPTPPPVNHETTTTSSNDI